MEQNLYYNNEETNKSYLKSFSTIINDSILANFSFSLTEFNEIFNILACQDKTIKIFSFLSTKGTIESTERLVIPLSEAPTCLQLFIPNTKNTSMNFSSDFSENNSEDVLQFAYILYGTANGSIGLIKFNEKSYEILWNYNENSQSNQVNQLSHSISTLALADIDCDGYLELAVGRVDGKFELFKFTNSGFQPPVSFFSVDLLYKIQSIQASYGSVILALSSGRILAYVPTLAQELGLQLGPDGRYVLASDAKSIGSEIKNYFSSTDEFNDKNLWDISNENYLMNLKSEIKELKYTLQKEKEKSKKIMESSSSSATSASQIYVPEISVDTSLELDENLAAYVLRIELTQTDLDLALVRCPCPIEIIETENNSSYSTGWVRANMNNSIVSDNTENKTYNKEKEDETLLIYHNNKDSNKNASRQILLAFRPEEGNYGEILLTLVSSKPPKAAKIYKFYLTPLNLHVKINQLDTTKLKKIEDNNNNNLEDDDEKDKSILEYSGNLSLSLLIQWLNKIFPSLPIINEEEIINNNNTLKLKFQNLILKSETIVVIQLNLIKFYCDSVSILNILKDFLTKLANSNRIKLHEKIKLNFFSVKNYITLLKNNFHHIFYINNSMKILEGLQEINRQYITERGRENEESNTEPEDMNEISWLDDEYKEILKNQDSIRQSWTRRDNIYSSIKDLLLNLYIDWQKLQGFDGLDYEYDLSPIFQSIESNDFDQLIEHFKRKSSY